MCNCIQFKCKFILVFRCLHRTLCLCIEGTGVNKSKVFVFNTKLHDTLLELVTNKKIWWIPRWKIVIHMDSKTIVNSHRPFNDCGQRLCSNIKWTMRQNTVTYHNECLLSFQCMSLQVGRFFFGGTRIWTQCLTLARQVVYHSSHSLALAFSLESYLDPAFRAPLKPASHWTYKA
jgi:hypothetical protein